MNAFFRGESDLEHDELVERSSATPRRPRKLTCCICKARRVDLVAHVRHKHPGVRVDIVGGRVYLPEEVSCPECGASMHLQVSKFGHGKVFYSCSGAPFCSGAHAADRFGKPVGVPVDRNTKELRAAAESVFTATWRGDNPRFASRKIAFRWLRKALDLPLSHIHINRLDAETCTRIIEAVWE